MLTKQRKVLQMLPSGGGNVTFGYIDEDTQEQVAVYVMSGIEWDEFGYPMTITTTVVAGDELNYEVA